MAKQKRVITSEKQVKKQDAIKFIRDFKIGIVIAVFALTTLVYFWGQISGGSFFWEDFAEFVYPTQTFAASESANGVTPFWNPYSFSGMPFIADLQVGYFYPFNRILTFFVNSDGMLPIWILQFIVILHYFIAQLNMYFLGRYWKMSSAGAMISAVAYSFSMMIVCHAIHPMIVYHLAWFPLIFLFFLKGIDQNKFLYSIISGLILGMAILSGHPQYTLYIFFFLFFAFIWKILAPVIKKEFYFKSFISTSVLSALTVLIGTGIFCIQYLPSTELAGLSKRADLDYVKASEGSFEYKQLLSFLNPNIFGIMRAQQGDNPKFYLETSDPITGKSQPAAYYFYWETGFYFGIAALLLAISGIIATWGRQYNIFLLTTSIFGLFYAFGSNGFLWPIFYNLPFFGTFRSPTRMLMYLVFGFSLFAGFGFDKIALREKGFNFRKAFIIPAAVVIFFALLLSLGAFNGFLGTPEAVASKIQSEAAISLALVIISAIIIFLLYKSKLSPVISGSLLVFIIFLDLVISYGDFNASSENPVNQYELSPQMKEAFTAQPPHNLFRVNMRMYNPSYQAMNRNAGMTSRMMLIEGYNPLVLKRVIPPISSRDTFNAVLNVKYQVEIDNTGRPGFVENRAMLPRAWAVDNYILTDSSKIEELMKKSSIDYSKTVVLEQNPGISLDKNMAANANIKCIDYKSNSIKYEVNSDENFIFVQSEIWYPAWKAYIDGNKVPVLHANYCLRAIAVGKGKHNIEFKYDSEAYNTGRLLTLITIILSSLGIVLALVLGKRTKE